MGPLGDFPGRTVESLISGNSGVQDKNAHVGAGLHNAMSEIKDKSVFALMQHLHSVQFSQSTNRVHSSAGCTHGDVQPQ